MDKSIANNQSDIVFCTCWLCIVARSNNMALCTCNECQGHNDIPEGVVRCICEDCDSLNLKDNNVLQTVEIQGNDSDIQCIDIVDNYTSMSDIGNRVSKTQSVDNNTIVFTNKVNPYMEKTQDVSGRTYVNQNEVSACKSVVVDSVDSVGECSAGFRIKKGKSYECVNSLTDVIISQDSSKDFSDLIQAHNFISQSGLPNFKGCRIPVSLL
jgi:hypothetical protein